jgi:2-isopropylmalate synthase
LETLEFPKEAVSTGDGPIDAAFKAIDQIVGIEFELDTFTINAVSEGKDAQGEVIVKIAKDGKLYTGRGLSTDIIESSIKAYLNAINKMLDELRYTKRIDADD